MLLDHQRGLLAEEERSALEEHLRSCASCSRDRGAEQITSELLEQRLPRHAAPESLKRALAERAMTRQTSRWRTPAWTAIGLAAGVLLMIIPYRWQSSLLSEARAKTLLEEAVNDHLRVLERDTPLPVVSGDPHTVKPWFQGRLDFAPAVAFVGNDDFPLQGGEVSYFVDRKAATLVFKRRLHVVSLFVFRADGLSWPSGQDADRRWRGFSVLFWRAGDLGYALVSDIDRAELVDLRARLTAP
jgi:anti-sigma factor RsiW